ncbi:MAG: hypothetical protein ACLFTV_18890, partial [Desulfococcaceae bacterium]
MQGQFHVLWLVAVVVAVTLTRRTPRGPGLVLVPLAVALTAGFPFHGAAEGLLLLGGQVLLPHAELLRGEVV